jgi:hypothetical protein
LAGFPATQVPVQEPRIGTQRHGAGRRVAAASRAAEQEHYYLTADDESFFFGEYVLARRAIPVEFRTD